MTNEPKDRHVLATAVGANAEVMVTFNLRDFSAADTPAAVPVNDAVATNLPTGHHHQR